MTIDQIIKHLQGFSQKYGGWKLELEVKNVSVEWWSGGVVECGVWSVEYGMWSVDMYYFVV